MSFLGSLEDLSLPAVLQIASLEHLTGVFRLVNGPEKGRIFVNRGRIVFANSSRRSRLGKVLVDKGILDVPKLTSILEEQRRSKDKKAIGTLLMEKKLISRERLEYEIRELVVGVLGDFLDWTAGVFYFEKHEMPPSDMHLIEGLSVELILLEDSCNRDEESREVDCPLGHMFDSESPPSGKRSAASPSA